jgi:DNA helicase-2/ATP-dependent DNA helicase PcrA
MAKLSLNDLNPSQKAAVTTLPHGHVVVIACAGSGKCLGYNTKILLFNGKIKSVQDIKPGDLLMGPDSQPRKVISTSQGWGDLYRIHPIKGKSWVCNHEHVLTLSGSLKDRNKDRIIDIPLNELMKHPTPKGRLDKRWKLLRVAVDFPHKDLQVDPYLVGLWLGNGSKREPEITQRDREIRTFCRKIASRYNCILNATRDKRNNTWSLRFILTDEEKSIPGRKVNFLRRFFKKLSNANGEKFIPKPYLVNSRKNRLDLLAGLLDSDGYHHRGSYEITTKYRCLANNILFLARSLGFAAYKSRKRATIKTLNFVGYYYRISISGHTNQIPCCIPRKKASPRRQIKNVLRTGFTVEPIGKGDYYGFTLEGDGRFLLGDFTVTHNTKVITCSLAYLISVEKVDPARILLLTFTNRAAQEMIARARKMIGSKVNIQGGTFHSFCAQVLRKHGSHLGFSPKFTILDTGDAASIVSGLRKDLLKSRPLKGCPTAATITHIGSDSINLRKPLEEIIHKKHPTLENQACIEWIDICLQKYKEYKRQHDLIDFDDLLSLTLRLFRKYPQVKQALNDQYRYVLTDETQDTNIPQLRLIDAFVGPSTHLMAVADDAQSIYGFRGARHQNIFDIAQKYQAQIIKLEQNYRSTQPILDVVNVIQGQMSQQFRKVLFTERQGGHKPKLLSFSSSYDEAEAVFNRITTLQKKGEKLADIAVLYRVNSHPKLLESILTAHKIPYNKWGGTKFLESARVKDILAYLRCVTNPHDHLAAMRVLTLCPRVGTVKGERIFNIRKGIPLDERIEEFIGPNETQWPDLHDLAKTLQSIDIEGTPTFQMDKAIRHYTSVKNGADLQETGINDEDLDTDIKILKEIAARYNSVPVLLQDLTLDPPEKGIKKEWEDRLTLSTIHSAKGLEWKHVYLIQTQAIPFTRFGASKIDLEEERRILYVGLTRPKDNLTVSYTEDECASIATFLGKVPPTLFRESKKVFIFQ